MCILKIFSDTDSFKPYAVRTSIPVYSVADADDIRQKRTGRQHGVYRISFDVSGREWDDFPGQMTDAIAFLTQHGDAIRALINAHSISSAYLDFPLWSRLDGNIVNQNDHLPVELISQCALAGLGIELAIYHREAFQETPPSGA